MSLSTVTYTSISSDYEEPSDTGSPGVFVYAYDELPMHPVDPYVEASLQAPEQSPPSLDYVLGPEHPPSLDYVPGPEEPEQALLSSDYPLPDGASPAALSPGYVANSDLKEDLEEDLADYPVDGGDNDDDESSDDDDDDDDDDDVEEDEKDEEEEHLALVDSSVVPTVDPVSSAEDTEAFETDESAPTHYASTPTPPSPLTPLSSSLPQIPSPPLPVSSPPLPLTSPPNVYSPTYVVAPLGYKASGVRLRAASPSTHHPSDIPSPPLLLPSTTHRYDLPEADMPLQKRARFTAPTGRFEVGESSSAAAARQAGHTLAHTVDYGFIDTMDASISASESKAMTAMGVVNERVTDLAVTQRQDAQELYVRCEDTQDDRAMLGAQVSLLIRERRYFRSMASSYEHKAVISLQAWSHSKSRIQAIEA
ncbi:hypothetical protein Tco_0280551 [Tanacetum coccineum]